MSIGIVSNGEFEKEIERINRKVVEKNKDKEKINNGSHIEGLKSPGRGLGNKEVSQAVRNFVAELGIEGYSNSEIKELTGLSQSSISAYKKGVNSTKDYNTRPNEETVIHINKTKDKISRRAKKVAIQALDELLSNDRIKHAKTRDLATIARSTSAIIKEMEEEKKDEKFSNQNNGVQIIMMAPPVRQESTYDAIDVSVLDN